MKFMAKKIGQTGLLILHFVCMSACNPEEFFPTTEFIESLDAKCAESKDEGTCSSLNYCQSAFNDSSEGEAMLFAACVANPDILPPTGGGDGSTTGGTTGGVDGLTTGGTTSGDDASTTGGTTGGDVIVPPTIEEAWSSNCENLDPIYLYVKKIVSKKETTRISKVKVCHMTGNNSSHTIIIACPALQAHIGHEDYIGSCE